MQDNINTKPDVFSELMKQKLENHQLPVDLNDWSTIEKRLNKIPKRKIIPWWMWLPIGSVAVLALLFTLRTFNEAPQSNYSVTSKPNEGIHQVVTTPKQNVAQQPTAKAVVPKQLLSLVEPTILSAKLQHHASQNSGTRTVDFPHIHSVIIDSTSSQLNNNAFVAANTEKMEPIALVAVQQTDSVLDKQVKKKTVLDPNPEENLSAIPHEKSKNNWMLAASYGSQGNTDLVGNSGVRDPLSTPNFADNRMLSPANTNYTSIMASNDFTNKTDNDPLSFALMVRKQLSKTLSLESGLVYTYLLSTFENTGMQRSDAKLHLHYVGIPVNLITKLWESSKWEIYLSTGFMAEKGIQSLYIQQQYFGDQVITTTAKTKINGIQWSINGGAGVSYKIQRQLGIYFEPKFSHYFENNQPVSARANHPFVFGLSVGLRIGF